MNAVLRFEQRRAKHRRAASGSAEVIRLPEREERPSDLGYWAFWGALALASVAFSSAFISWWFGK